jgi:hypothetical protein
MTPFATPFAAALLIRAGALLLRSALGKKVITLITTRGGLRAIGGALLKRISTLLLLQWTFSTLWGVFVSNVTFIWNFNWAATDQELLAQLQARQSALAAQLGGVLGQAAGWLACGVLPGALLTVHNPAVGAFVLKEVGEEAAEELAASVGALARSALVSAGQQMIIRSFVSVRRWLFSPKGEFFGGLLLGENYGQAKANYLSKNSKPWSFALEAEERVDAIPNQTLRAFVEEFLEELWDSCVEAGFVVANGIDGWLASQKLAQSSALGRQRTVEITPNREIPSEKIVLSGAEELVKPVIVQTLTQHQLLDNRDIGQIVGISAVDYTRASPLNLWMKVHLYSRPTPPYGRRGNQRFVEAEVTIPDVIRTKIDWERIKFACGGANGYFWGRYRATATLTNGRQMAVYASTESEAEQRVKAFLQFSSAELKTLSVTEEKKEGARLTNQRLYKETTKIYPGYLTIFNKELQTAIDRGTATTTGNFVTKKTRIPLWTQTKPDDFEQLLTELFRRSEP